MSYFNDFQSDSYFDEPYISDSWNENKKQKNYRSSNFSEFKCRYVDEIIGIKGKAIAVKVKGTIIFQPLKCLYRAYSVGKNELRIKYKMTYLWDSNIKKAMEGKSDG